MSKRIKGQSTLEYAIVIAVIVGALVGMQIYIKRGIEGRLRSGADDIGEQYSPGLSVSNISTGIETDSVSHEEFGTTGATGVGKGVSKYSVVTPANTFRRAEGEGAEQLNTSLGNEDVFWNTSAL